MFASNVVLVQRQLAEGRGFGRFRSLASFELPSGSLCPAPDFCVVVVGFNRRRRTWNPPRRGIVGALPAGLLACLASHPAGVSCLAAACSCMARPLSSSSPGLLLCGALVCSPRRISPVRRIAAHQPGAFSFYFCSLFPRRFFSSPPGPSSFVRRGALLLLSLWSPSSARIVCCVVALQPSRTVA